DLTGIARPGRSRGTGLADPTAARPAFCFDASIRYIGGEPMDVPFFPRLALIVGAVVRVAYGLHALLAPEAMGRRRLAPRTHGKADPRLSLRGFGGQLVVLGGFTLLAARSAPLARPVTWLNAGIDTIDLTAGALEARARRRLDRTVG